MQMDSVEARNLIEARLGRQPQDMIESAVVLEAWAGIPAQSALETGEALMRTLPPQPQASVGRLPKPGTQEGFLLEALAFVMTVVAIACWASPLVSSLGAQAVETGVTFALPVALALQWGLQSRYLGHPEGLAELGRRWPVLVLGACALVALPTALLGIGGAVGGLLTLTWTGGAILIRRRWAAGYALTVVLATVAMIAGLLPAGAVLGATAGVTTLAVALAVAISSGSSPAGHAPRRWGRALHASAIGAGLGLILVVDNTVTWSEGMVPALALVPSTVASLWGGYHLRQLDRVILRSVSGVAATDSPPRRLAWPPLRVLMGAIARVVGLTAALSAALVLIAASFGSATHGIGVLIGFGLLALAMLLIGFLESAGQTRWTLVAVGYGVAVAELMRLDGAAPFPGAGLVVAAALAVLVSLPAAIALLSRPASTLATALWIT
jgi:hypothetical protein